MKIYKNLNLLNLDGEIWKTIKEYPEYQVSNLGRIKSFKQDKINGKIRKQNKSTGYFQVDLSKNGISKPKKVHILVYETFNNYKLKDDDRIHHVDKNPENNIFENLKLMVESEHNSFHHRGMNNPMFGKCFSKEHKKKMSEKLKGENNPRHKLTEEQVIQIKLLLKEGKLNQQEIADIFNISRKTISNIKIGKTWSYIIV